MFTGEIAIRHQQTNHKVTNTWHRHQQFHGKQFSDFYVLFINFLALRYSR